MTKVTVTKYMYPVLYTGILYKFQFYSLHQISFIEKACLTWDVEYCGGGGF